MTSIPTRSCLVCISITLVGATALGCRRKPPEFVDVSLPIMVKQQLQTIEANGWKVQRWVAYTGGRTNYPVDVWIRITSINAGVKQPPVVKADLKLTHKDPKFSRVATVKPEVQECSKLPKRLEHARWGRETETHEFPPKELCWEAMVKDPFNSDRVKSPTAISLAPGEYDLDVRVYVGLNNLPPYIFAPIRMNFPLNDPRDK